jgi:2-alkenal reductase
MRKNQQASLSKKFSLFLVGSLLSLALAACGNPTATTVSRSLTTPEASVSVEATATSVAATTSASATTAANTSGASITPTAASVPTATPTPAQTTAATTAASAQRPLTDAEESTSVIGVVRRMNPAVVTVYNRSKYTPGRTGVTGNTQPTPRATPGSSEGESNNFVLQGVGSGIFISADGYLVTNEHVINGQDDLMVALNDGKAAVPAKLIGKDRLGDLAVLKIDTAPPAYAKWADKIEVGETVIAIGSALGNFRNSVSKGVVSGLNRTLPGDTGTNVYLQTDTAINPGNSGGPLLNLRGEIVGINTAVLRSTAPGRIQRGSTDIAEGLGFAIPSNVARLLVDQMVKTGKVVRPYFGITYQMITPAEAGTLNSQGRRIPQAEGAWISTSSSGNSVRSNSPADKAGLKDNDIITAIDGEPLNDNNPLVNVILKHKPGDTVKLTVQRGDQTLTMSLTLVERPEDL